MHPFEEMKSWVGYTDADLVRLRALWPHVEPRLDEVTDAFYREVLAHPGAADVLREPNQVERLRLTLRLWVKELLLGPHDEAYYHRRERIGRRHVEVGLHARYMVTAMHVMRRSLCEIADRTIPEPGPTCAAIGRITDIDLAIMNTTFVERREEAQASHLQDLIVSHLPVAVLLLDDEGRVRAATRPGIRLFGDQSMLDRHYTEALPAALVEAAVLADVLARAGQTGREITLPRVDARLDERDRCFRVTVVPIDQPERRLLVHVEELTDAVRAEARLQRSESLAQLGALSAAVAHELRNPLAGISGAIQVIARSLPPDDRRKPIMEKVEQQVQRLNDLVTDLLDFARPSTVRTSRVDLAEQARGVVELVQGEHPDAQLSVQGSGMAVADPNLVHQILLNLLQNALQAAGPEAEVRLDVRPGQVRVSDSGPGVAPELAEKVFQPFFTTRAKGTGLGLAICRKQATAMQGRLSLGQGPLRGACFVLDLPQPED